MFKNPFVFFGRIRRKEYGLSVLIFFVALCFFGAQIEESDNEMNIYMLTLLPIFWFRFAQGAKRCHDLGNSGWYQIIPFYGFWLLLEDGQMGPNQYGDNPKDLNYPNYPNGYGDKQPFNYNEPSNRS